MPGTFGLVIHLLALVTTTSLAARIGDAAEAAPAPAAPVCCCKPADEHLAGVQAIAEKTGKLFQDAIRQYKDEANHKRQEVCKNTPDENNKGQTKYVGELKAVNVKDVEGGVGSTSGTSSADTGNSLHLRCCRFKDEGRFMGGACSSFWGGSAADADESYCKATGAHDKGIENEVTQARDDVKDGVAYHNQIKTSITTKLNKAANAVNDFFQGGYEILQRGFVQLGHFAERAFMSKDVRKGLGLLAGATLFGLSVAFPPAAATLGLISAGWFCFLAVWDAAKAVRGGASAGEVVGNFVLSIAVSGASTAFLGLSIPGSAVTSFWAAWEEAKGAGLSDIGSGIASTICSVVSTTGSYSGPFTVNLHKPPPRQQVLTDLEDRYGKERKAFFESGLKPGAAAPSEADAAARQKFFGSGKKPAEPTAAELAMANKYYDEVTGALKEAEVFGGDVGNTVSDGIASMFTCGGSDMVAVKK